MMGEGGLGSTKWRGHSSLKAGAVVKLRTKPAAKTGATEAKKWRVEGCEMR